MGKEKVKALNDINLEVKKGEICCLLGPSGSGKSTLLNLMAGFEKPSKGSIHIKNYKIDQMTEDQLAIFRKINVGFVFQSFNLLSTLTALENVTLPLIFNNVHKKIRNRKGTDMLQSVGLGERLKHKPSEMSGGQQQRVSIARAFINDPKIIFADEPTGNLDTKTTKEMMDLIVSFAEKNNQTLLIVTHNIEIADYADRIIFIRDGCIEKIKNNDRKSKDIKK